MPDCSQCGSSIAGRSIDGRCPGCLLALALEESPGRDGWNAAPPPPLLALPCEFGEFTLLEELGRGGMGVVYRARQKRLNRDVALKLLLAGPFANPENRRRFLEESTFAASLHHPHLVKLFDAGEHAGTAWCAMELIEGGDLEHALTRHGLAPRELAALMAAVARAVAHAHERGVVHRDLKPSNILIDGDGDPHVADFGLARRFGDGATLTVSGRLLGTPAFWPPDQLEAGAAAGPAGDIYALGAILYAGLTGRPPFQTDSLEALLLQIVSNDPVPPRRLNPDIPRDLETICLKCLEKNPSQRYPTAGELADDLGRYLDGRPVKARPAGPAVRLAKWAARRRTLASSLAMLALAVIVGSVVSFAQWRRAESHARELAATVAGLRLDRAESRLEAGKSGEGLALLAAMLREDPGDRVAAQRLVSALHARRFVVPSSWETPVETFRGASAFSLRRGRLIASTNEGRTLTLWNMARTGSPDLERTIEIGEPVRRTALNGDATRLLAATQDGRLTLHDAETGEPESGPFALDGFAEQLAFSPDGRVAVVVTVPDLQSDNYRRLEGAVIDLDSGERLHADVPFHGFAFSPDGRWVVTLDYEQAVVRDAATWMPAGGTIEDGSRINMAVFSPDSERLLTAGASGVAAVWKVPTGERVVRMRHPLNVQEAFFSPDASRCVTVDNGGWCRLWDASSGRQVGEPFPGINGFAADSFRPDGARLVTRAAEGLRLYDPRDGTPAGEWFKPDATVTAARFLADGEGFVTTSPDCRVRLWGTTGARREPMEFRDDLEVEFASVSPDGGFIATGVKGSWARVWSVETGREHGDWLKHGRSVRRVRWSPDGDRLVTASRDRTARLWSLKTGRAVGAPMRHEGPVWDADFGPDSRWVATVSGDHSARLWDADDGAPVCEPLLHDGIVTALCFHPGGGVLATGSRDGRIRSWTVPGGMPFGEPLEFGKPVTGVAFSPAGDRLAAFGESDEIRVWRFPEGTPQLEPIRHASMTGSVDFSPDGAWIATASHDGTARVWEALDGRPVSRPLRHEAAVLDVRFSPNGRLVLTTSADGTARVWDAVTGHSVSDPMGHDNKVVAGSWFPDGRRILTASIDRTAKVWPFMIAPDGPAPAWLPGLAELRGGFRSLGDDVFDVIAPERAAAPRGEPRSNDVSKDWDGIAEDLSARFSR